MKDLRYLIKKRFRCRIYYSNTCTADHIGAVIDLKDCFNAKVLVHNDDYEMLRNKGINHSDKMGNKIIELEADRKLNDKDEIIISNTKLSIIHTPGHSKGSICIRSKNVIFTGDTLFAESIGRTEFRRGSYKK